MAEFTIEQQQAIALANARARANQAKPEQGNMYTQSPEDIVYSPEGIPLNTASYGSEAEGPTKTAQKVLTTAAGVPVNYAMATAKPVSGMAQLVSKIFGSERGNEPVRALNQIEQGVNQQSYAPVTKGASLAGDIGNPLYWGAGNILNKAGSLLPVPKYAQNIVSGVGTGATIGVMNPINPDSDNFAKEKLNEIGTNSLVGGALPVVSPIASKMAGFLGKTLPSELFGLTTGTGGETIRQATKAGVEKNADFLQNMRGQVPVSDVLEAAQSGLQTLKNQRRSAFEQGFQSTKNNQTFLDFLPIEQKFNDSINKLTVKGVGGVEASKVGQKTLNDVNEIKAVIDEWKRKPELHTAEGLDALKRRIDDVYSNDMSNEAKSILTQARNTVKQTIVKQDPQYAKTMRDYEESLGLERELEKALGLGDKTSIDAALRKLQSITRNNANTSFEYRKQLANVLKNEAGIDLMPALAGQQLNTATPRGIQKYISPSLTLGVAATNPVALAALPLQSPRLVGEGAYKVGQIARPMINLANSGNPEQRRLALMLLQNSMRNSPNEENK